VRGGSEVELIVIEGGGHSWPGGERLARFLDPPSSALDASDEIWRFFARH
jgi:Poly(3-hydroxybutyrate) depolymerase